jgi:hypothetical protein
MTSVRSFLFTALLGCSFALIACDDAAETPPAQPAATTGVGKARGTVTYAGTDTGTLNVT